MRLLQILCAFAAVLLGFGLLVSVLVMMGMFALRALHRSRAGVLRISRLGGLTLASVFLGFRKIVHPHVPHAVVQQEKDDDDAGEHREPRDGDAYRRQLRCIRRGEEPGDLVLENARERSP